MMYINRAVEKSLQEYLTIFPVVGITGPRQSGKSTMLRQKLEDTYRYITFDDPFMIDFLNEDPRGFMSQYDDKVIFDEVQKAPEIFSYIKIAVDNDRQNYGKFIITGSSQFSMLKEITESLAGRIGLLSLLPFQYTEIPDAQKHKQLIFGGYPELVVRDYRYHADWYSSYLSTYIERDVRNLFNIGNHRDFTRFIGLLAARCSQELNMSIFSRELGVDVKTIQNWISVLEASYIIFLLPRYHNNFGKRIVKRPKVYFFDTGLLCFLTGISSIDLLNKGPLRGAVFENYFIGEMKKRIIHSAERTGLYYFRSNSGLEIDLIEENKAGETVYYEIKNNNTPKIKMTANLRKIVELDSDSSKKRGILIYTGSASGRFSDSIEYCNYRAFLENS